MAVSNCIAANKRNLVIGLDLEWSIYDGTNSITRLLQMSLPVEKTALINLSLIKAFSEEDFLRNLKLLLENKKFICVGRQIGGDAKRLSRLGVDISNYKELRTLALQHNPEIRHNGGTSLCNSCRAYLHLNFLKTHKISD